MKQKASKALSQIQSTFTEFTAGQKVVAIIGTAALLLAALFMFRWASAPSLAPLYTDLTSSSAGQVVEQLNAQGVQYELADGGATVMVPSDQVYSLRSSLASEGVTIGEEGGYSILDKQGLSTSQFKEQTDFKRAMEGELSKTIETIDGIDTAIVHLAMPEARVFQEEQDPTTASVIKTKYGVEIKKDQVQAITNLVASSIDGLTPDKVTVTDSAGRLLSAPSDTADAQADAQTEQVQAFQSEIQGRVQSMLDTVVGHGNSTVNVNADLSFDEQKTEETRYFLDPTQGVLPPLSETKASEVYNGTDPNNTQTGVVGPDGQMDPTASGSDNSSYAKNSSTADNPVNKKTTQTVAAPGGIRSLHVGVALDTLAAGKVDPQEIQALVAAAIGIDEARGDSLVVSSLPFDKSAAAAAAAELKAADDEAARAQLYSTIRTAGAVVGLLLVGLFFWLRGRKKGRQRVEATSYVVEQMRREAAERAAQQAALQHEAAAIAALEASAVDEANETLEVKQEIQALVERQPEDVATLLRGWLVER